MGSNPKSFLPLSQNSALELDGLGSKPSTATCTCVAFAELLNISVLQSHVSDGDNILLIGSVRIKRKHTQGIWIGDSQTARRKTWLFGSVVVFPFRAFTIASRPPSLLGSKRGCPSIEGKLRPTVMRLKAGEW